MWVMGSKMANGTEWHENSLDGVPDIVGTPGSYSMTYPTRQGHAERTFKNLEDAKNHAENIGKKARARK